MATNNQLLLLVAVVILQVQSMFVGRNLNFLSTAQSNTIDQVCDQTRNPSLCRSSFGEDPRSQTADLNTLAQISIQFSRERALSSLHLLENIIGLGTNATATDIYYTCLECYRHSIAYLADCAELLGSGDYFGLNIRASAALDGPVTCDASFAEQPGDIDIYEEPRELSDASRNVQESCSVILVIANMLNLYHQGDAALPS